MKKLITYTCLAMTITACGEKSEPERTVEWYKENDAERQEMVEKCKYTAAKAECRNAIKADNILKAIEQLKNLK